MTSDETNKHTHVRRSETDSPSIWVICS